MKTALTTTDGQGQVLVLSLHSAGGSPRPLSERSAGLSSPPRLSRSLLPLLCFWGGLGPPPADRSRMFAQYLLRASQADAAPA